MNKLRYFFMLICLTSFAQESNGRFQYILDATKLPIFTASEYLLKGYPIGKNILLKQVNVDADNLGEYFQKTGDSFKETNAKTAESTNKIINNINSDGMQVITATNLSNDDLKFDLDKFKNCLTDSNNELKKLLALEYNEYLSSLEKDSIKEDLETILNFNRAINNRLSPVGGICGRFLGAAAFEKLNTVEELKMISVLKQLENVEAEKLLYFFISSFHQDSPFKSISVVDFMRRSIMLEIEFNKQSVIPDMHQLKELYEKIKKEEASIEIEGNAILQKILIDEWPQVESAIKWAKEMIERAKI